MKIAIWNIGHFSGGNAKNSTIPEEKIDAALSVFRDYIHEKVGADLLCLCEMSAMFAHSETRGPIFAKDVLLDSYPYAYIGAQHNYSCNAVFAKESFDVSKKDFICNETVKFVIPKPIAASDYYYLKASIILDGTPVTLVVCHLAFDNGRDPDTVNTDQLHELAQVLASEERVVIVGDFNCHRLEYFNVLKDAGYTLGNDGSLATCETEPVNCALDNIITKGVCVKNVRVHRTALSDHNALSADISLN